MRQIRDILEKTISLFRKIFDFLSFITFWVAHQVTGIRVGEIETRAIGHFSAPIEIYLSELDVGVIPKGKRDVWFNNAFVANRALLSKWKRYLRVGPRWYLSSVFRYCSEHPHFASLKVTEYRHWNDEAEWQVYDKHRVLPAAQHHCQFSEAEVAACEKSLKLLGIENNFICVLVRDTAYRGELQPTHRDADIETLIPALADLSKQGVQSVRMGAKVSHSINTTEPGIINYAGSPYWSEILDLYLISKCMFMISTGSGLDSVGTMFRKPLCMVNISELYSWRFYQPEQTPVTLIKLFWSSAKRRYLTLEECFKDNLYFPESNQIFGNKRIIWVDNSEDELKHATQEMFRFQDPEQTGLAQKDPLQKSFRDIFRKYVGADFPSVLSPYFLSKHREILF